MPFIRRGPNAGRNIDTIYMAPPKYLIKEWERRINQYYEDKKSETMQTQKTQSGEIKQKPIYFDKLAKKYTKGERHHTRKRKRHHNRRNFLGQFTHNIRQEMHKFKKQKKKYRKTYIHYARRIKHIQKEPSLGEIAVTAAAAGTILSMFFNTNVSGNITGGDTSPPPSHLNGPAITLYQPYIVSDLNVTINGVANAETGQIIKTLGVTWGDGTFSPVGGQFPFSHTYLVPGNYNITVLAIETPSNIGNTKMITINVPGVQLGSPNPPPFPSGISIETPIISFDATYIYAIGIIPRNNVIYTFTPAPINSQFPAFIFNSGNASPTGTDQNTIRNMTTRSSGSGLYMVQLTDTITGVKSNTIGVWI